MSCSLRLPHVLRALVLVPLALAACGPDKGPGSLEVRYVLGNNKMCAEVGVDRLRAELTPVDPEAEGLMEVREDVTCVRDGVISLDELTPGLYSLTVLGYDDGGVAIFDNLGDSETERRIEIFEAAVAERETDLTSRPAELGVAWALGENGLSNCGGVGISNFEITAYQAGGGTELLDAELDCEQTGNDEGYRIIDDPDRTLNGTLFGEVGVQALGADGSAIGAPVTFEFEPVGPGYPVRLAIECTDLGCNELE